MPKIVDRELRRDEVLAATCELIARDGLDSATMRRIADEAGCTTGRITHYFAGKREILIAALRQVHLAAAARMSRALAGATGLRALEAVLHEALPLDEARRREWRVWLAFWGRAPGDALLVAEQRRRYAEWSALVTTLLRAATRSGELRPGPAVAVRVDGILALIDGLGLQATLEPERLPPARQRALVSVHLDGLRPPR